MDIGELIKQHRKRLGLSQKKLGEMCVPPIDASHIRRIESGKTKPTTETLDRISKALNRDIASEAFTSKVIDDYITYTYESLFRLIGYGNAYDTSVDTENGVRYWLIDDFSKGKRYKVDEIKLSKLVNRCIDHLAIDFEAFLEEQEEYGREEK